jgi:hypothetical protein
MDAMFCKLNTNWNAEPNAPYPSVEISGNDVSLRFLLNPWQFPEFSEREVGILRFIACQRYRLGATNDRGWYLGQCRFSKLAPEWGEFYSVTGNPELLEAPKDWKHLTPGSVLGKHYLFYFRDETFECVAENCVIEPIGKNALHSRGKKLSLG